MKILLGGVVEDPVLQRVGPTLHEPNGQIRTWSSLALRPRDEKRGQKRGYKLTSSLSKCLFYRVSSGCRHLNALAVRFLIYLHLPHHKAILRIYLGTLPRMYNTIHTGHPTTTSPPSFFLPPRTRKTTAVMSSGNLTESSKGPASRSENQESTVQLVQGPMADGVTYTAPLPP